MSDTNAEESHLVTPLPLTRAYHWLALEFPAELGLRLAPGCGRAGSRIQAWVRAECSNWTVAAMGLRLGLELTELELNLGQS